MNLGLLLAYCRHIRRHIDVTSNIPGICRGFSFAVIEACASALVASRSIGCSHQNWRGLEPRFRLPSVQKSKMGRLTMNLAIVCLLTSTYWAMGCKATSSTLIVGTSRTRPGLREACSHVPYATQPACGTHRDVSSLLAWCSTSHSQTVAPPALLPYRTYPKL